MITAQAWYGAPDVQAHGTLVRSRTPFKIPSAIPYSRSQARSCQYLQYCCQSMPMLNKCLYRVLLRHGRNEAHGLLIAVWFLLAIVLRTAKLENGLAIPCSTIIPLQGNRCLHTTIPCNRRVHELLLPPLKCKDSQNYEL